MGKIPDDDLDKEIAAKIAKGNPLSKFYPEKEASLWIEPSVR